MYFILILSSVSAEPQISTETINITKFALHKGIYFEFQDNVKTSHTDWNMVAYTDLTSFSSKYTTLRKCYDATANICGQLSERFAKTDLPMDASNSHKQQFHIYMR